MWCNVSYCFRCNGDLNVHVIWDNLFLNVLLIKVNVSMAVKYFLFDVLIFIDVFRLKSDNNFNILHPGVSCIVKNKI